MAGGGGLPGLITGSVWRFVGSATAGTVAPDPLVEVVEPFVVEVAGAVVLEAELDRDLEVALFPEAEGVDPQAARTTGRSRRGTISRRRTGVEDRACGQCATFASIKPCHAAGVVSMPDRLPAGVVVLDRWRLAMVDEVLAAVAASVPELNQWMG